MWNSTLPAHSAFWKARLNRKLVESALELGMPAMALLDRNGCMAPYDSIPAQGAMNYALMLEQKLRSHLSARDSLLRRGCRANTLPNLPVFRCSVKLVRVIRISVASSHDSKCGRRRSKKEQPSLMIWRDMLPGWRSLRNSVQEMVEGRKCSR